MTGYEIVRCAIEFQHPERSFIRFSALGVEDMHWVPIGSGQGWQQRQRGEDDRTSGLGS